MPRAGRPQVNVWLLAGICMLVVAAVVVAVALLARGSGETGVRIYDPAGGAKDEVRTADIVKSSVEVSGVSGIWLLGFQLTPDGAREFHRLTRSLAQRGAQAGHPQPFAFAVDGHVYARPPVDYHSSRTASRAARGSRYRGCAATSRSVSRWRCASRSSRPSRQGASRRPRRRPPQGRRPRLVAAGGSHTCALTASGKAKCWGANTFGELGNGAAGGPATPNATPLGGRSDGRRRGDRRRSEPHVCVDRRTQGRVLGLEPVRPARRRRAEHAAGPCPCRGARAREGSRDRRRRRPHLRGDSGGAGHVLGAQRQRPARRRHDGIPPGAGGRPRACGDPGDRRRRPSHLCADERRRGLLLGLQPVRPARGRDRRRRAGPPSRSRAFRAASGRSRPAGAHVRADPGRHGRVLGVEQNGPARERVDQDTPPPGRRPGPEERPGDRGRRLVHLRAHERGDGGVLGLERQRPARRRDDPNASDAGPRHGLARRYGDCHSRLPHLRADDERPGRVLGSERVRSARRRYKPRPSSTGPRLGLRSWAHD